MDKEQAKQLINKYLNGQCSTEEKALLERFYMQQALDNTQQDDQQKDLEEKKYQIWNRIERLTAPERSIRYKRVIPMAAAIAFFLSFGMYFYFNSYPSSKGPESLNSAIYPGSNSAILTLADGSKIKLNDGSTGEIARQAGIVITKTANGLLYTVSNSGNSEINAYNTIETPRGGQYQVLLPDGSKVWLNASSSLRYPLTFGKSQRKVELLGEAYFEIAKEKGKPFLVVVNETQVEVLGTRFNVNAYNDEKHKAITLIEGSVGIKNKKENRVISPGQQAKVSHNIEVAAVDTTLALGWKTGYFMFKNKDLTGIMREISRWYDVDVVYQNSVPDKAFLGKISRYKNVADVLKVLELTGSVHFKIEGRRIIVMP